jgi:hypothetical protein
MKKMLLILLPCVLLAPAGVFALELSYPTINNLKIELGMDIGTLVMWFYYFIVTISGLAAFAMIVWGGISWLTSAGNPSKTGEAKDRITSAILGLLLILGSWIIINLINPDLLRFGDLSNYFK